MRGPRKVPQIRPVWPEEVSVPLELVDLLVRLVRAARSRAVLGSAPGPLWRPRLRGSWPWVRRVFLSIL